MTEPTAGDLVTWLKANPGKQRVGAYVMEYVGEFSYADVDEKPNQG